MLRQKVEGSYQKYVADYKNYLRLRDYGEPFNDWLFFRRAFLECWLEPGFHRFWQVWNPGIGYFVYKLYLRMGGRRRRDLATLAAFVINGILHNLVVMLLLRRADIPLPFTFLSFGVFTVAFRRLAGTLPLEKVPRFVHGLINLGLVALSFDFGFTVNNLLH